MLDVECSMFDVQSSFSSTSSTLELQNFRTSSPTLRPPATLCRWSQCRFFLKKEKSISHTPTPPLPCPKAEGRKDNYQPGKSFHKKAKMNLSPRIFVFFLNSTLTLQSFNVRLIKEINRTHILPKRKIIQYNKLL